MATTTHIKFGDGLDVTDEGAGVIRVDTGGGGGVGGSGIQFDTDPQTGGFLKVTATDASATAILLESRGNSGDIQLINGCGQAGNPDIRLQAGADIIHDAQKDVWLDAGGGTRQGSVFIHGNGFGPTSGSVDIASGQITLQKGTGPNTTL